MGVEPNHTIVAGRDQRAAARLLTEVLGLPTWADPGRRRRGLYFDSPEGHNHEVLTVPYGG